MKLWRPPRGRVLVLAPHPDDDVLGCGGALALHRRRGDHVKIVFLTDGMAGDPKRLYARSRYRALRRREAGKAAHALGVRDLEFWDYPDRRLSREKDLAPRLADLIERERPRVVYRTSDSEPHPDHRALAAAVGGLARGRSGRRFLDCAFEVEGILRPTHVADVGRVFAIKVRALREHCSQLRYRDLAGLAERTGVRRSLFLKGAAYGEAFRAVERRLSHRALTKSHRSRA